MTAVIDPTMGVQPTDEMRQFGYCSGYSDDVDLIREREYPMLQSEFPCTFIDALHFLLVFF